MGNADIEDVLSGAARAARDDTGAWGCGSWSCALGDADTGDGGDGDDGGETHFD